MLSIRASEGFERREWPRAGRRELLEDHMDRDHPYRQKGENPFPGRKRSEAM
jgi:hypothetical protein